MSLKKKRESVKELRMKNEKLSKRIAELEAIVNMKSAQILELLKEAQELKRHLGNISQIIAMNSLDDDW
jgi:cell fate (sporulation/competence/biofilm development) regulator YlbF (YheA/YmcA/DUF963 family)